MSDNDNKLQNIKGPNLLRVRLADHAFQFVLIAIFLSYLLLILFLVGADVAYLISDSHWGGIFHDNPIVTAFQQEEIRNSVILSLLSCTLSANFSVAVAIPICYFLKGKKFPGRVLIDSILDIPIVLPPLVIGLSLLILFQFLPLGLSSLVVYQVPAVILAQFTVATAIAICTMKASFEQTDSRQEEVALTLGCSRFQAFNRVVLPEVAPGIITAWTLAWARSLGEFGPILVFAGATRNKTEVLSTTVFLEISIGNLEGAVTVSLIMILLSVLVLVVARIWGKLEFKL